MAEGREWEVGLLWVFIDELPEIGVGVVDGDRPDGYH
jgi:hypothetical protein